jgi:hypothetical protein
MKGGVVYKRNGISGPRPPIPARHNAGELDF